MDAVSTGRSIVSRMIRAARLQEDLYEEVEHDRDATRQAVIVVVGTNIAWGISAGVANGIGSLVFVTVAGLLGWAAYAWITYFVGTRIFASPETGADWGELARTLAFATSPRALMIVSGVPVLGVVVVPIVFVWMSAATIVALRTALDFSTKRAIATALVGFIAFVFVFFMVGVLGIVLGA